MRNLFGAGRHPDAERLEAEARAAGRDAGGRGPGGIGWGGSSRCSPVPGHPLQAEVARRLVEHNCRHGTAVERAGADRGAGADPHRGGRRDVPRRARPGAAGRPGAGRVPGPSEPAADHRGGRLRPDVHAGEVGLGAVGGGAAGGRRGRWRRRTTPPSRATLGVPGAGGAVHPPRPAGRPAGQDAWAGHRPVHPPRRPLRRPEPAHPRRGQQQGAGRWPGDWLAVDGRPLHKAAVTLSETYNTLLESELSGGWACGSRPAPLRTASGRSASWSASTRRWLDRWSSRSSAIESRRRVLAAGFQRRFGRPPTAVEAIALGQQATLETRQAKHAPRSEEEQRRAWRAEAEAGAGLTRRGRRDGRARDPEPREPPCERSCERRGEPACEAAVASADGSPGAGWTDTARQIVEVVSAERATWQIWHLRAEAQRQVRGADLRAGRPGRHRRPARQRRHRDHCVTIDDPDPLLAPGRHPCAAAAGRRRVGLPAARPPSLHLGGGRPRGAATCWPRRSARGAPAGQRGRRVRGDHGRRPRVASPLDSAQRNLVRDLLVSGAACSWPSPRPAPARPPPWVCSPTPGAAAAARSSGLAPPRSPPSSWARPSAIPPRPWPSSPGRCAPTPRPRPGWSAIGRGDLWWSSTRPGMASTRELAAVVSYVESRGGSVRLVGDDRQLAAVAAGGVLRDLLHQVGAVTLTEVHRFRDNGEAAATLAIRDGDPTALGFYADRGRIHAGDLASAADQAFDAWAADREAGLETHPARPDPRARRRAQRPRPGPPARHRAPRRPASRQRELVAAGRRVASRRGDTVITRRNLRTLAAQPHRLGQERRPVDRRAGPRRRSLTAPAPAAAAGRPTCPPTTSRAAHLQLGYATTVHGAQGITVDTAHTVLTGAEDRRCSTSPSPAAAPPTTSTSPPPAPATPTRSSAPRPCAHPPPSTSCTRSSPATAPPTPPPPPCATARQPPLLLHEAAARYHDAVTTAAEHLLPAATADELDDTGRPALAQAGRHSTRPRRRPGPPCAPTSPCRPTTATTPSSCSHTRRRTGAADRRARRRRRARTPARPARLHARRGRSPGCPASPRPSSSDPEWGDYLTARAQRVDAAGHRPRTQAAGWTAADAPTWAQPLLGDEHAQLRAEVAVWRAAHDVPDDHPGPPARARSAHPATTRPPWTAASAPPSTPTRTGTAPGSPTSPTSCATTPGRRCSASGSPASSARRRPHRAPGRALTADRPLPDEQPAAALWWRLVGHLGPAAVHQALLTSPLRPDWLADLQQRLDGSSPTTGSTSGSRPRLAGPRRRHRRHAAPTRLDRRRSPSPAPSATRSPGAARPSTASPCSSPSPGSPSAPATRPTARHDSAASGPSARSSARDPAPPAPRGPRDDPPSRHPVVPSSTSRSPRRPGDLRAGTAPRSSTSWPWPSTETSTRGRGRRLPAERLQRTSTSPRDHRTGRRLGVPGARLRATGPAQPDPAPHRARGVDSAISSRPGWSARANGTAGRSGSTTSATAWCGRSGTEPATSSASSAAATPPRTSTAGPKYLNTRTTAGVHQGRSALRAARGSRRPCGQARTRCWSRGRWMRWRSPWPPRPSAWAWLPWAPP